MKLKPCPFCGGDAGNELLPVSTEDLIKGEWYAFKCCGSKQIGKVEHINNTEDLRVRCGNHIHSLHDMILYGPIRFTIGGAGEN